MKLSEAKYLHSLPNFKEEKPDSYIRDKKVYFNNFTKSDYDVTEGNLTFNLF